MVVFGPNRTILVFIFAVLHFFFFFSSATETAGPHTVSLHPHLVNAAEVPSVLEVLAVGCWISILTSIWIWGGGWGCGDGGWSGHNRPSSGLGAVIRQTAIVCTDMAITGAVARHPGGINDTLSLQRPLPAVGVIRMRIHTVCVRSGVVGITVAAGLPTVLSHPILRHHTISILAPFVASFVVIEVLANVCLTLSDVLFITACAACTCTVGVHPIWSSATFALFCPNVTFPVIL